MLKTLPALIFAALISCLPVGAYWNLYSAVGYRQDNLSWTIGVPGIDILSELKWQNLRGIEGRIGLERLCCRGLWLNIDGGVSGLWKGRGLDSDFAESNRRDLFSRSVSCVDALAGDGQLAAGYAFCVCSNRIILIPQFGGAYHGIRVRNSRARDLVPDLVPFANQGILATYAANWITGFIGGDGRWDLCRCLTLRGWIQFHLGSYLGVAHWGRHEFDKFTQCATAYGVIGGPEVRINVSCHWQFFLNLGFQRWWTSAGQDIIHLRDGGRVRSFFNGAVWTSWQAHVGLLYQF